MSWQLMVAVLVLMVCAGIPLGAFVVVLVLAVRTWWVERSPFGWMVIAWPTRLTAPSRREPP